MPPVDASPIMIAHQRPGPLVAGELVDRPNRFLTRVRLGDDIVEAHLADRGRLEGIIEPGAQVFLTPVDVPTRRTKFTVVCARVSSGVLCSVEPAGANRLVGELLRQHRLRGVGPYRAVKPEVTVGDHRFDFALIRGPRSVPTYVEVKSAVAVKGRTAMFPDAPSTRAVRHTDALAEHVRDGGAAALVICAQRADVSRITPHPVDPAFAEALAAAKAAGVRVIGVAFDVALDGFRYLGRRPVEVS